MKQRKPNLRRHALAFAAAPFVAAALWAATAFVWLAWVDGLTAARGDIPTLLVGAPFIGLPVAVGLVLFVAGPLYAILEATVTLTRSIVLAAGLAIGVVTPIAGRLLVEGLTMINSLTGAIIGLGTAWAWWAIAEGGPGRTVSDNAPRET